MTIAADVFTRVQDCAEKAAKILENGQAITPQTVYTRRCAADIAKAAIFDALQAAFITPVDREDLWRLCEAGERLLCAAERFWLEMGCQNRTPSSPIDTMCHALARACRVCGTAADPSSAKAVRYAQQVCYTVREQRYTDTAVRDLCDRGCCVAEACEHLLYVRRYTTLKNT